MSLDCDESYHGSNNSTSFAMAAIIVMFEKGLLLMPLIVMILLPKLFGKGSMWLFGPL
jgi:hypothetical protein